MKTYTMAELITLRDKWLDTLDNDYKDEWYTTDRGIYGVGVHRFFAWLNAKETTP